jgi:hypothetical protein
MAEGNQGNGGTGQESGTGTQGQGQEPASQQGQQGGTGQEPGQQGEGQNGQADIAKMSPTELASYAAKLQKQAGEARTEAANYRTQYQQAQDKLTEAERAKLSEQERVAADLKTTQERNQTLESQVKDLTTGAATREALAGAGAINAMTAFKTLDLSTVETDDQGTPKAESLALAITKLKASDPYLFRRNATSDAGAGQQGAPEGATGINDFIRGRNR